MSSRFSVRAEAAARRAPEVPLSRESLRETIQLLHYLAPYRRRFLVGMGCLLVGSGLGLCFPLLAGGLIDAALHSGVVVLPGFGAKSLDEVALILAGTIALQAFAAAGGTLSFNRVGQTALADLRRDTYGRLIGLPMAFFTQRRVGELASRISGDIAQLESGLVYAVPQLCRQTVMLAGGIVLIALTSGKLTLAMLGTVPFLIAATVGFGRKLRRLSREMQDRLAATGVVVEETLQGIASVKAFANEAFELDRFQQANVSVLAIAFRAARWRAVFFAAFTVAMFGGIVIVLWVGARLLQTGEITAGELTRFGLYTTFVAGAMGQAAELYSQIQRTVGASQRVRELLREPVEIAVSQTVAAGVAVAGAVPPSRLRGAVEFARVCFRYPSRPEVAVLREVSLSAQPGEIIALVGPSGAGKSTLTALLLRFYEPDGGRVLIDGRDARNYELSWLRGQMAIVPQDVLLFGGTIAENIGYGRPGASAEEIRAAAQQANAAEFIDRFPEGYATVVGDRGVKLSGGQRQRVAIARAILKNPAILILDEATSSLDSENERLVQEALELLMRGRTTFIVAHRLATVRRADRIAVLEEGRIVEIGTHEELSAQSTGLYRRLSSLQFQGVLPP